MSHLVPFTLREIAPIIPGTRAWKLGQCTVFAGIEEGKWHLSISHQSRYPTWDEIKEARYRLIPDEVTMVMMLPPRSEYVNVHSNCFHLHEIPPGV